MNEQHLRRAVELARLGMRAGRGGPFGAVVVRDGEVIGEGCNEVTSTPDPTAHAEVVAIRAAARRLGRFWLDDCEIYASCEPCPMCLGAVMWARIPRVWYAAGRADAAAAGFSDQHLYDVFEGRVSNTGVALRQHLREEASAVFEEWRRNPGFRRY